MACAELSSRSLSLMAAMSADASSLKSTHAGGSVEAARAAAGEKAEATPARAARPSGRAVLISENMKNL